MQCGVLEEKIKENKAYNNVESMESKAAPPALKYNLKVTYRPQLKVL